MNRLIKETFTTMKNDVVEKTEGLLLPISIMLGTVLSIGLSTVGIAYVLLLLSVPEIIVALTIVGAVVAQIFIGVWVYTSIERAQKKIEKENNEMIAALGRETVNKATDDGTFNHAFNSHSIHSYKNKGVTW